MLKIKTVTHEEALELLSQINLAEVLDLGAVEVVRGDHITFGPITVVVNATGGACCYVFD